MIQWRPPTEQPEPGEIIVVQTDVPGNIMTGRVFDDVFEGDFQNTLWPMNPKASLRPNQQRILGWIPAAELIALPRA